MRKMRMCFPKEKTFADGFEEYILDCKPRNLREGAIHHYRESVKLTEIAKIINPIECPYKPFPAIGIRRYISMLISYLSSMRI